MKSKNIKNLFWGLVFVLLLLVAPLSFARASSTLTAAQTVANVVTGTNDQTAVLASTTPNVIAQQSIDDITISPAIAMASTSVASLVIDGCTISFDAKAQDLDCTNSAGNINTASSTTNLQEVANLSQMLFTNYTASASTTNTAAFRLTHKNAAINGYVAINGPSLASTATSSKTLGYAAVAEIDDITIAGTADVGDTFSLKTGSASVASSTYTYTVLAGATTAQLIGDGLYFAFQNSSASTSENFTVSTTTGNKVRITARTAGTGNTVYTSTTNYPGVAQQITFTPANVAIGETFTIYINNLSYSYKAINNDGVAAVVAGLATAASANSVATCVNTTTEVTCTAKIPGTAFTSYSAGVSLTSVGGSSSSGSVPVVITALTPTAGIVTALTPMVAITKTLRIGNSNKEVNLLQRKLQKLGFLKKTLKTTNYFGLITRTALIKFQKANKIKPANGLVDKKTRARLNSLAI